MLAPFPLPLSRSRSPKAPGAASLLSGRVVGVLKHGHPLPESSGCVMLTVIGATYFASPRRSFLAVAFAAMLTLLTPKSFVKNVGEGALTLIVIESFGTVTPENEIPAAVRV